MDKKANSAEKDEVEKLIAELGHSTAEEKPSVGAGDASSSSSASTQGTAERKKVPRRNSGSTSSNSALPVGSPTDGHGHLLKTNAKITKKYNRKSRQGKGRGLAKKGGGGGQFKWGAPGSELLEEFTDEVDDEDLADLAYNKAKAKMQAGSTSSSPSSPPAAASSKEVTSSSDRLLESHLGSLKLTDMDKDIKPLLDEYFANGDAVDFIQSVKKFDIKERGASLVAFIVTIGLEKCGVYKELVSRLLHDLSGVLLRPREFADGFDTLLTNLADLSLDNPECSSDLGKFIARAIADKCIENKDGQYFAHYKGHVKCEKMQSALDKAETLLRVGDFYFLNNIWGRNFGGFRPVRELAENIHMIISEFYDSGDANECQKCLSELNVPHFHHEFVYELIDFALEKDTERAQQLTVTLLQKLTSSTVITYDQLKTGMLRAFDDLDDISLDVPNAFEQIQTLLKQLEAKKVLNHDIISNMPAKGRKRFISEGDGGKLKHDVPGEASTASVKA